MKIRYKFGVWMLCLMFPALVCRKRKKYMYLFYAAGTSGDFSPGGQCRAATATLQSFRGKNLVLAGREAATEKRFLCRDQ